MKMVSTSIYSAAKLWVALLILITVPQQGWAAIARQTQTCVSSCGKITNVTHPFRLKGDPPNCGDSRYELECVNDDVALLRLSHSAEYRVQAINYNNYTIRLVDPNIEEANCSSIPRYFLYKFNFSDVLDDMPRVASTHRDVDLYHATQMQDPIEEDFVPLFEHIMYMRCESPVRDSNTSTSTSTSTCLDLHTYVVAADLKATGWRWKPGCHVKLIAATSGLFQLQQNRYLGWDMSSYSGNSDPTPDVSYGDVHRALAYGFELSWLHATCRDHGCGSRPCYFSHTTQKVLCYSTCSYPMRYRSLRRCGIWTRIRSYTIDYLYPFLYGMYTLIRFRNKDDIWNKNLNNPYAAIQGRFALLSFMAARVLFGVTLLVVLLIYKWRRRHLSTYVNIESFLQDNNFMPIRYSYKEIKKMTKNFKVKLGQGGFGSVYKGKLRSGPHVAIKMLKESKANGQEFINEMATIGRIHHMNVVRLIGFCVEGSKRALVYDFMPNGSLDKYIFSKEGSISLSYEKIYEISLGIACGISYLHQGCDIQILHFDIKPHNILLDENFIPKVSDFGLAKLYPIDHSIVTLTDKRGTPGYIAPELFYNNLGGISYKADVYSFGMLLMEMAGRRRNLNPQAENSSQIFFPTWVYDQFSKEKKNELDTSTEDEKSIAKKMVIVALWCIQLKPFDRPSMKRVLEMLEGELAKLTMPPKPLLYPNETPSDESLNYEQHTSDQSTNATSEFGETTPCNIILENSLSG